MENKIGQVLLNKTKSFWNKEFIRDQSLILASAVLVASRIVVANVSAIKAQGSPEGPYRYRESIRTDMREIGGFTTGFLVLRALQAGIKKGLRKGFNIVDPKSEYGLRENLKKAWKGEKVAPFRVDFAKTPTIAFKKEGEYGVLGNALEKMPASLKKFFGDNLKDTAKADVIRNIYRKAPIIIGSVPTVLLAGTWLERMTRDHSEKIVDVVSKRLGGSGAQKNMGAPTTPVNAQAPARPATVPQFGAIRPVSPYRFSPALFSGQRV